MMRYIRIRDRIRSVGRKMNTTKPKIDTQRFNACYELSELAQEAERLRDLLEDPELMGCISKHEIESRIMSMQRRILKITRCAALARFD